MGKGKRNRERRQAAQSVESSSLAPDARSFELKLTRAQDHLQDVEEQTQRWLDDCLKTLREEPDPQEPGYFCAWIDAPPVDVQTLSLRVGDCLQCFRSALDHLAFELASAFTIPMTDEIQKDSAFPILSDVDRRGNFGRGPNKWRDSAVSSGRGMVRGIELAAQTAIEGLQPYKRGQSYDADPLWRLGELNNIDKHRVLHVVSRVMSGATMPVNGPRLPKAQWSRNVRAIGRADGEPFLLEIAGDIEAEGRTRVARWPMLPIDPREPMHMGFRPVLNVVFASDTPLVADAPVLDVLREIRNHIVSAVLPPLVGFLK